LSTQVPPNWVTSNAHLAIVVMVRPFSTPAAATISTPWQITATGLPVAKKCRVIRIRSGL
jgi:hypothetical protein